MCSLNLNKCLKLLLYMFEVAFTTPVVDHMGRPVAEVFVKAVR
jgi:hypothetical protein